MDNKYDIKVVIPYQVGQKIKVVVTYNLDKQFYRKMNKCRRTLLDRGGEKGHIFKAKRYAMYHKKDRVFYKTKLKREE